MTSDFFLREDVFLLQFINILLEAFSWFSTSLEYTGEFPDNPSSSSSFFSWSLIPSLSLLNGSILIGIMSPDSLLAFSSCICPEWSSSFLIWVSAGIWTFSSFFSICICALSFTDFFLSSILESGFLAGVLCLSSSLSDESESSDDSFL